MKWFRDRFRYAFAGIRYGVLKDRSIVLQIVFGWIAIVVAFVLRCTFYEWLWILLCITLVVVGELRRGGFLLHACNPKEADAEQSHKSFRPA